MERLIKKGAEADLYLIRWRGLRAILKRRKPKPYLQPALDRRIRELRTLREASYLVEAKELGVPTPVVYFVDPFKAEIIMQMIEGPRLKDALLEPAEEDIKKLLELTGRHVARLHEGGLIHGDLTTSNFIIVRNRNVAFIDFGLAFSSHRLEDKAVDLHLLRQVLKSAHTDKADEAFDSILNGYEEIVGSKATKQLMAQIKEIERRGRYARVV